MRIRMPHADVSSLYTAMPPAATGLGAVTVNGQRVTPTIKEGYAEILRAWKKGDRIEFELPLPAQYVRASDKIEATRGKVAIRRGPLVYNLEQVDQDITQPVDTRAPLSTEWRPDLLGGVMVIKGRFVGGAPFMAIPNFARVNRNPPPPPRPPAPATQSPTPAAVGAAATPTPRPAPPPPTSIVWLTAG
jgi:hypothetical protein